MMKKLLFILGFLLLACPAWASLSVVQAQNNFSSAGVTSLSVSITTTAGNLIVAWGHTGDTSVGNVTFTDSASQTYTAVSAGQVNVSNRLKGEIWYVANSAALTSVTVQFSASGPGGLVVYEISGAATSSPADGSVNATATSATSITSGSLTTTNANDILLFAVATGTNETTWTAGAGYTIPTNGSETGPGMGAVQYQIVSSTQSGVTTSMSFGASASRIISTFAAFKAAAGGAPPPAGVNKRIKIENLDPISYFIDPTAISNFPGCDVTDAACTMEIEVCDDQIPPNCLHIPADGLPHLMQAFFIAHQTIPAAQAVTSAVAAKASSIVITAVQ